MISVLVAIGFCNRYSIRSSTRIKICFPLGFECFIALSDVKWCNVDIDNPEYVDASDIVNTSFDNLITLLFSSIKLIKEFIFEITSFTVNNFFKGLCERYSQLTLISKKCYDDAMMGLIIERSFTELSEVSEFSYFSRANLNDASKLLIAVGFKSGNENNFLALKYTCL